jgi:hypothetical protein
VTAPVLRLVPPVQPGCARCPWPAHRHVTVTGPGGQVLFDDDLCRPHVDVLQSDPAPNTVTARLTGPAGAAFPPIGPVDYRDFRPGDLHARSLSGRIWMVTAVDHAPGGSLIRHDAARLPADPEDAFTRYVPGMQAYGHLRGRARP